MDQAIPSGRTAAWPSRSRTSRTPRTSPRWRRWSDPSTSRTGADLAQARRADENIQHYIDMGFDEIHLHNVGRNQDEFIDVFGKEVLPELRLTGPVPVPMPEPLVQKEPLGTSASSPCRCRRIPGSTFVAADDVPWLDRRRRRPIRGAGITDRRTVRAVPLGHDGATSAARHPHYHRTISESFYVVSGSVELNHCRVGPGRPGRLPVRAGAGRPRVPQRERRAMRRSCILFAPGGPREDYFAELAGTDRDGFDAGPEERAAFLARHDQYASKSQPRAPAMDARALTVRCEHGQGHCGRVTDRYDGATRTGTSYGARPSRPRVATPAFAPGT